MKDDSFLPEYRGWEDLFGRWTDTVMIVIGLICLGIVLAFIL